MANTGAKPVTHKFTYQSYFSIDYLKCSLMTIWNTDTATIAKIIINFQNISFHYCSFNLHYTTNYEKKKHMNCNICYKNVLFFPLLIKAPFSVGMRGKKLSIIRHIGQRNIDHFSNIFHYINSNCIRIVSRKMVINFFYRIGGSYRHSLITQRTEVKTHHFSDVRKILQVRVLSPRRGDEYISNWRLQNI